MGGTTPHAPREQKNPNSKNKIHPFKEGRYGKKDWSYEQLWVSKELRSMSFREVCKEGQSMWWMDISRGWTSQSRAGVGEDWYLAAAGGRGAMGGKPHCTKSMEKAQSPQRGAIKLKGNWLSTAASMQQGQWCDDIGGTSWLSESTLVYVTNTSFHSPIFLWAAAFWD